VCVCVCVCVHDNLTLTNILLLSIMYMYLYVLLSVSPYHIKLCFHLSHLRHVFLHLTYQTVTHLRHRHCHQLNLPNMGRL